GGDGVRGAGSAAAWLVRPGRVGRGALAQDIRRALARGMPAAVPLPAAAQARARAWAGAAACPPGWDEWSSGRRGRTEWLACRASSIFQDGAPFEFRILP